MHYNVYIFTRKNCIKKANKQGLRNSSLYAWQPNHTNLNEMNIRRDTGRVIYKILKGPIQIEILSMAKTNLHSYRKENFSYIATWAGGGEFTGRRCAANPILGLSHTSKLASISSEAKSIHCSTRPCKTRAISKLDNHNQIQTLIQLAGAQKHS